MPRKELPKKRLPFFVRLKTVDDMTAVAKIMAEIKAEVKAIEDARAELKTGDERKQKVALLDIAIGGVNSAAKADEIIDRILDIRRRIAGYLRQVEKQNGIS